MHCLRAHFARLAPQGQLLEGLKGARSLYGKQKVLRSEEASARAKAMEKAFTTIEDPNEAMAAAAAAMRGEYTKTTGEG